MCLPSSRLTCRQQVYQPMFEETERSTRIGVLEQIFFRHERTSLSLRGECQKQLPKTSVALPGRVDFLRFPIGLLPGKYEATGRNGLLKGRYFRILASIEFAKIVQRDRNSVK